jgi:inner membrane protein
MLPDADILIHVPSKDLFNLLIHRHFTHSLAFIPVGGLAAAVLAWLLMRRRPGFFRIYCFAAAGYATGGLLDACTSYGTHLYWPFSNHRAAWDAIAIIDPVFTLLLLFAAIFAFAKRSRAFAAAGLILALCYLGAGFAAQTAASRVILDAARHRGHAVERMRVMPTIGNLILWRGVYQAGGRFHVDAVRLGLTGRHRIFSGPSVPVFQAAGLEPALAAPPILRDIRRFAHFCDGYLFTYQESPLILGDLRYSLLPHQAEPLWGLVVAPENRAEPSRVKYYSRISRRKISDFWRMLKGSYP